MYTKFLNTLAKNKSLLFISIAVICLMNVTILVLCCMPNAEFSFEIGIDKGPVKLIFQVNRGENNTKPRLKAAHPIHNEIGGNSLLPNINIGSNIRFVLV